MTALIAAVVSFGMGVAFADKVKDKITELLFAAKSKFKLW